MAGTPSNFQDKRLAAWPSSGEIPAPRRRKLPDCVISPFLKIGAHEEVAMVLILLIILAALLGAAIPVWPHSRNWGYYPSGGIGIVIMIIILLLLITAEN